MQRKLEVLWHWIRTGKYLEHPPVIEGNESPDADSPYSIQVRENLLGSYGRRWEWRLLDENGKLVHHHWVYTDGIQESKRKAIKAANCAIDEIVLRQRNDQQEWENVDTN